MTDTSGPVRPHLLRSGGPGRHVDPRVATSAAVDLRVSMVLAVLGGTPVEDVAHEHDVELSLLNRWVRDFLAAGSAVVTNRPEPDEARQRDRFLAAFAHELRTPVAVAGGWALMLAEGDVPEDQVQASLVRLSDALRGLAEHIEDVELSTSASLGRVRLSVESVDVSGLARELEGSPGVRRGADLAVTADPQLLRRVLRDLWATAQRDPAPTSVGIDVVETGRWQEIRVVREGTPISPTILEALFDPFDANDDATGVTIGLYLARALTVAHGGVLGAESDDHGTVLFARLPREPAVGTDAPASGTTGDKEGSP